MGTRLHTVHTVLLLLHRFLLLPASRSHAYLLLEFEELSLKHGLVLVVQPRSSHVGLELVHQRLPVADIHRHTPLKLGLDLGLDGQQLAMLQRRGGEGREWKGRIIRSNFLRNKPQRSWQDRNGKLTYTQ